MKYRLVVLAILDGWGLAKPGPGNAIQLAHTPNMTKWRRDCPHTELAASGRPVGLPDGVTGNSEVGHLNLGAGRVVLQDEVRINEAIADGSFFTNQALLDACENAKKPSSALHLMGLVGPGQVHSDIDHLWALLKLAQQQKVPQIFVHVFSDGRDSSPTWLGKNGATVEERVKSYGAQVASVVGRYYAMDRDNRWERTAQAYRLLAERKGARAASLETAAAHSYTAGKTDEFIEPTVVGNGRAIAEQDSVIFFNYRTDRPRQLTAAFIEPQFKDFDRVVVFSKIKFWTMTSYADTLPVTGVAFKPEIVDQPLAEVVSQTGEKQLHAAETEKYAHVTYFFNGGREEPFAGEERILVHSPKVATYDLQPEMSAQELTDQVCQKIEHNDFALVVVNFANADMVGHTGNLDATIKAVETVDDCLGTLWKSVEAKDGVLLITADHGNAEIVTKPNGEPDTEHNASPVPLLAVGKNAPGRLKSGALANVSPTVLEIMGLEQPAVMTAESLWEKQR